MDLDHAIGSHSEWRLKFRNAISKQEEMDVATISADNRCELGKWLHGEARNKFGQLRSYADCIQKHAAFHAEAGRVASVINAKKYAQAERMLDGGTGYANASSDACMAISLLKKEARL